MKTIRWVVLPLIAVVLVVISCSSDNKRRRGIGTTTVVGSGVMAQEDRPVGAFTGLLMMSEGDVHITLGGANALRVQAEDNILQHIDTFVQGGSLVIETESGIDIQPTLPIEYHLTVVSLDTLVLSGVGDIDATDLNASQVTITLAGVGNIDITALNATDLTATISGVGSIALAGQVDSQTVTVSGIDDYEGANLLSEVASVTITGLGDATVNVSTTLTVTITGSGSVFYIGDPTVNSVITGTGTVQKIG